MLDEFGTTYMTLGDLEQALKAFRDSLAIRERLVATNSSNTQWQRDLSISYSKVGDVLVAQGTLDDALKAYRGALDIIERLVKADAANAGWQRMLSASYNKVGNVLMAQGKLTEALQAYRDSLAVIERLAGADPTNAQWQQDLQYSIGRIGGIAYAFVLARNFVAALEAADQAISLASGQVWLRMNRAHALMFLGRADEARALYLQYRGTKNVQDNKSWETVILEDFADLRRAGLTHPVMEEIERKFNTSG